jgi:tRNA(Ile2) C34 agmatinyltransferase TiaS
MSDHWRNSYDAWKTRDPDTDARVCDACGGWLRYEHRHGWHCERCDERDPDRLREDRDDRDDRDGHIRNYATHS